jgi:son of sevenless
MTPRDLAVALTVLEGERYNCLLSADYIDHLLRPSTSEHIIAACTTNNKIIFWVKRSMLLPEKFEHRAEVFKFFLNTAVVCLIAKH